MLGWKIFALKIIQNYIFPKKFTFFPLKAEPPVYFMKIYLVKYYFLFDDSLENESVKTLWNNSYYEGIAEMCFGTLL